MNIQNLNLARKWRSKNFDQMIGQDLSVKMLKNSLFLNHYFPVYLFSGQRGCGKTSAARIFAAALNCATLPEFQKNPTTTALPCLVCQSCIALYAGKHPDFIEIDAASNNGVDNVRSIIDSSALLPLMGRKKIYLIDEAHMLSKAAFNAFLKLMEEPPASVIFILATTDTQKIIETVRSRCFQLFFKPVTDDSLVNHLAHICDTEHIGYDTDALSLMVKETGGSIRDAINLLEQVRFSASHVSKEAVYGVLGHLDEARLLSLFEIILYKSPVDLLQFCKEHTLEKYSADFLWLRIIELLRASIWIKNGIVPQHFSDYTAQLQFLLRGKSIKHINALLEMFYANETVFRKTTAQYPFLEIILLRMCQKNESNSNSSTPAMASQPALQDSVELEATENEDDDADDDEQIEEDEESALWANLVGQIQTLKDPLLESIFKQGSLISYNKETGVLAVDFPKELQFFSDIIESTKTQWQALFMPLLGKMTTIEALFTKVNGSNPVVATTAVPERKTVEIKQAPATKFYDNQKRFIPKKPMATSREPRVDVSNKELWPQAHLLLQHFPGEISQIKEL